MVTLTDEQRVEYEKRNRRIIAAARSGADYTDLASRFGVNRHRISQIATAEGIFRRRPRRADLWRYVE